MKSFGIVVSVTSW